MSALPGGVGNLPFYGRCLESSRAWPPANLARQCKLIAARTTRHRSQRHRQKRIFRAFSSLELESKCWISGNDGDSSLLASASPASRLTFRIFRTLTCEMTKLTARYPEVLSFRGALHRTIGGECSWSLCHRGAFVRKPDCPGTLSGGECPVTPSTRGKHLESGWGFAPKLPHPSLPTISGHVPGWNTWCLLC